MTQYAVYRGLHEPEILSQNFRPMPMQNFKLRLAREHVLSLILPKNAKLYCSKETQNYWKKPDRIISNIISYFEINIFFF